MKSNVKLLVIFFLTILMVSCKKGWLDVKRDISKIVPTTLTDMRLLLNSTINLGFSYGSALEMSSDNVTVNPTSFLTLSAQQRNILTWKADFFDGTTVSSNGWSEWNDPYRQIETANIILEGLEKITPDQSTQTEWNDIKGSALFYRGKALFDLVQHFSKPYDPTTAVTDLGVSIRSTSDINVPTTRSTLKECYDQIIADLNQAVQLLRLTPSFKTDPSLPAAHGLLARIYLSMRKYELAFTHADACLQKYNTLLDYNTVNQQTSNNIPFGSATVSGPLYTLGPLTNPEIIFYGWLGSNYSFFFAPTDNVDISLYNSYATDDLRKAIFFRNNGNGTYSFKGHYSGTTGVLAKSFGGTSTNEIYLIRAECFARTGNVPAAMADLNTLMMKRWKNTVPYPTITATNAAEALQKILTERRKELIYRGLRWQDLRRFNLENANITLTRVIAGQTYTLPPNDPRYVLPIPLNIIQITGIQQNPR